MHPGGIFTVVEKYFSLGPEKKANEKKLKEQKIERIAFFTSKRSFL